MDVVVVVFQVMTTVDVVVIVAPKNVYINTRLDLLCP